MVDFPNAPTDGDVHTENGTTWIYKDPPGAWSVVQPSEIMTPVDIVDADVASGWQVWGDTLIQWGRATSITSGLVTITFPQAFKTIPSISSTTMQYTAGIRSSQFQDTTETETRFVVNNGSGNKVAHEIGWLAIGEAPDALKKPKTVQTIGGSELQEYHDPTGVASWKIVGNTLECWGRHDASGTGTNTVSLPKTFKYADYSLQLTPYYPGGSTPIGNISSQRVNEFDMRSADHNNSGKAATYRWYVIGEWDGVS